jgi:hypothetical protein
VEGLKRPGIQDIGRFNPSSPRLPNTIAQIFEVQDAVGVGIDTHQSSLVFRHLAIPVSQVKADRMGVHFQRTTALARMTDQTMHVHLIGLPFTDEPTDGVGQDSEMRVIHGAHDPLGLFLQC